MSTNPFITKKSVHINLTKESHAALRERLFRHDITMQDIFQEFAFAIMDASPKVDYFINNAVNRKIREQIQGKLKSAGKVSRMEDCDVDSLYNLIEEENQKKLHDNK